MDQNTKEFYWKIGNRIKDFRMAQNCSVEKLAEMAGISAKYLYQIENGRVSFATDILYRLCHALGVTSAMILAENQAETEGSLLCRLLEAFTEEEKAYVRMKLSEQLKSK